MGTFGLSGKAWKLLVDNYFTIVRFGSKADIRSCLAEEPLAVRMELLAARSPEIGTNFWLE